MNALERSKFRYVNKDQLASVEIIDAKRKQSSRSVRARARETSVTMQHANVTMQSTLLSYNRLKSRGKRIKVSAAGVSE
jgi:alpha-amylase/alpha-mannosidase (GH57 family)